MPKIPGDSRPPALPEQSSGTAFGTLHLSEKDRQAIADAMKPGSTHKITKVGSEKANAIESARTALLLSQFDELNSWWAKAEKRLAEFRVPHDVHLSFNRRLTGSGDDEEYGFESDCIGWWKRGNEWRICWGKFFEPQNENCYWTLKAVADCPMQERVDAVRYFPNLIEAVRKARNDYIPKVGEAVEKLRSAVQSMSFD